MDRVCNCRDLQCASALVGMNEETIFMQKTNRRKVFCFYQNQEYFRFRANCQVGTKNENPMS